MTAILRQAQRHEKANREMAARILAEPEKWPPIARIWAEAFWFATNTASGNGSKPDARVKVAPVQHQLFPEVTP